MRSVSEHPQILHDNHERRLHARRRLESLAYIHLGEDNRALVFNLSEGGLAVQASAPLIHNHSLRIRFYLPESKTCIETNGLLAWVSESKKEAGIRFLDLSTAARGEIKEWISRESSQGGFRIGKEEHLSKPFWPLRVGETRLDQDLAGFVKNWKECNSRFHDHTIHCDPDWIEEHFKREKSNVRIFFLEQGEEVVGAVPFVLHREELLCQLGEFTVAKFPMKVLQLQGYTPNLPANEFAHDLLFGQLLGSGLDAIQMNHIKAESFLWNYLRDSPLIRKWFRVYSRRGVLPHLLIRIDGTFDSYMKQFSAQTRKNRRREIKLLRKRGQLELIRVSRVSEIEDFLEAAYAVARRARQFDRLGGWGVAARDRAQVRDELNFLAERGWLRSYLLKCGGVPCAFILGQQYGGTFYADTVGTDRAWRKYSAGTVLLMLVLEDLFKENSLQFYDFGSHVKWQEYFANESFPEASVWLFRRRAYPHLAGGIYRACSAISRATGTALDWLRLKSRVKQALEWR